MAGASLELDLLGTRFSIATNDRTWASFLRDLWGGFETTARSPARPVEVETGPDGLRLSLPGHPTVDFDDPWILAEVLRYWIAEDALASASGLVLIHAATVLRDGLALLLVGASGAGKTSLTLALLDAGWALGSDDVAALDPATGLIRPFPKPLGIRDPSLWRALGRTDWAPPWPASERSPILIPPRLFARAEAPFPARWVAFVTFAATARPRLEPLSPGHTALQLTEHTRTLSPEVVGALARLSEGTSGAGITYPSSAAALALLARLTDSPRDNPNFG